MGEELKINDEDENSSNKKGVLEKKNVSKFSLCPQDQYHLGNVDRATA